MIIRLWNRGRVLLCAQSPRHCFRLSRESVIDQIVLVRFCCWSAETISANKKSHQFDGGWTRKACWRQIEIQQSRTHNFQVLHARNRWTREHKVGCVESFFPFASIRVRVFGAARLSKAAYKRPRLPTFTQRFIKGSRGLASAECSLGRAGRWSSLPQKCLKWSLNSLSTWKCSSSSFNKQMLPVNIFFSSC